VACLAAGPRPLTVAHKPAVAHDAAFVRPAAVVHDAAVAHGAAIAGAVLGPQVVTVGSAAGRRPAGRRLAVAGASAGPAA
jgi:hypothetical protein